MRSPPRPQNRSATRRAWHQEPLGVKPRSCQHAGKRRQRMARPARADGRGANASAGGTPTMGEESRAEPEGDQHLPTAPMTWMERLRRVFAIDLSLCPHCGGRVRVIADVTRPDVIQRIKRPSHRWPSHGMSPTSRGPRLQPEPPLADRALTPDGPRGPPARPEELQLPHRRCRLCAFGDPVRRPATSMVVARQMRIQLPPWSSRNPYSADVGTMRFVPPMRERPGVIDEDKLLAEFVVVLTDQDGHKDLKSGFVDTRQCGQPLLAIHDESGALVANADLDVNNLGASGIRVGEFQ